ncbi:hypothetical protein GOBAR_DD19791 [Gossypium barbadense]|nr:hypothetical protein GOBAR_DD19791 [Gossypium barbadense]
MEWLASTQNFCWCCLRNFIPCNVNLVGRGIAIDVGCHCYSLPKSLNHCLLYCRKAKEVWDPLHVDVSHTTVDQFTKNCLDGSFGTAANLYIICLWFLLLSLLSCRFFAGLGSGYQLERKQTRMAQMQRPFSVFEVENKTDFVIVIWDAVGAVVLAYSAYYPVVMASHIAKLISVKEALSRIKDSNMNRVIIELDNLML